MFELLGAFGKAIIYANELEQSAVAQIISILNHPVAEGANIRIMPDAHYGTGCVIGYTAKLTDRIVPNLIGVDIGCGILTFDLGPMSYFDDDRMILDLDNWHNHIIRGIPNGEGKFREKPFLHTEEVFNLFEDSFERSYSGFLNELNRVCVRTDQDIAKVLCSLGTLGGGNHFIELGKDENSHLWQTFHSGSRGFGYKVAQYHQKIAIANCGKMGGLEYLTGRDALLYCHDMKVAQNYARLNRYIMAYEMLHYYFGIGIDECHMVESVHNYIDFEHEVVRKGAISARKTDEVVIPFNMRDGMIIGRGKNNVDWNCSAPHGSGRSKARGEAKRTLNLEEYKQTMKDAGVQSNCVTQGTIDESPMAYKNTETIIGLLDDTVQITNRVKPMFNFKAEGKDRKKGKKDEST